jgi:Outer membrane protein beta-barrel domain
MTTKLLLLGLVLAVPLQAQKANTPRFTLGAGFGGVSATSNLAAGADWRAGWSAVANLTYRLTRNLGLRGDATIAQNDLSGFLALPGEQRFNKVSYLGNLVWQTVGRDGERVHPYVLAGAGAVRVHDMGSDSSFTRFGGDVGVGVSYRLGGGGGRLGLRAEGRDVMYKFDRFGYQKTQNDMLWQGGVTLGI